MQFWYLSNLLYLYSSVSDEIKQIADYAFN